MKQFLGDDFLLETETAKKLFFSYAKDAPIFDYHNHLSSLDIAEHRKFRDLYELWLETDHYKWRAMRANGVPERLVTGDGEPYEKFLAFATILPRLAGSPLYHWCHLELRRYFGIGELLSASTAPAVWEKTRELLAGDGFDAVSLLRKMGVETLCTTDDPADGLEQHARIAADSSIPFRVLPSFRPDRYLMKNGEDYEEARAALCRRFGTGDIREALSAALDHFKEQGCLMADHGFWIFDREHVDWETLRFLCGRYRELGITCAFHLSPIRDNNVSLRRSFGHDAGGDSVGVPVDLMALREFLMEIDAAGERPKMVLFNLNPADNLALCTMANNYSPDCQFGAAWWFNDTKRGIEAQLDCLMDCGMLASSVGMLTDSRSFTSFVRHEYFRRILCNRIGSLVESGQFPDDPELLGSMVRDICYDNAAHFFA